MGRSDNSKNISVDTELYYNAAINRNYKPTFLHHNLCKTIRAIFPEEYQAILLGILEKAHEAYAFYEEKAGSYWEKDTNMAIALGDCKVGKLLYHMLAPKDKDGNLLIPEAAIDSIRVKLLPNVSSSKNGEQKIEHQPVAIVANGYTIGKYTKIRLAWILVSPSLGYTRLQRIVRNARNGQFDYFSIALLASDSSDSQELLKTFVENYVKKYLPLAVQKDGLHLPVSPSKKGAKPVYELLDPSKAILCARGPRDQKQSQKKR